MLTALHREAQAYSLIQTILKLIGEGFWLGQNLHQGIFIQLCQTGKHRQLPINMECSVINQSSGVTCNNSSPAFFFQLFP